MPLLIDKGLQCRSASVRDASITTLASIVSVAAPHEIATQLAPLIAALLEALSSLEASAFNMLDMHADRLGMDRTALEEKRVQVPLCVKLHTCIELPLRFWRLWSAFVVIKCLEGLQCMSTMHINLQAASKTPIHGALDTCARLVDDKSVNDVAASLARLVQQGVLSPPLALHDVRCLQNAAPGLHPTLVSHVVQIPLNAVRAPLSLPRSSVITSSRQGSCHGLGVQSCCAVTLQAGIVLPTLLPSVLMRFAVQVLVSTPAPAPPGLSWR